MRRIIGLIIAGALAACGNTTGVEDLRQTTMELGGAVLSGDPDAPVVPPDAFAQKLDSLVNGPLLVAYLPQSGALAGLVPFGENGSHISWATQDDRSLVLQYGVLTATRGLGDDLMSADVSGTIRALRSGGGEGYPRVYRHLGGDGRTAVTAMECEMKAFPVSQGSARKFEETCVSDTKSATNSYWIDRAGRILRSNEFVSDGVGSMEIRNLSD